MFSGNSTVDWCEGNYVISSVIAEFWNTLSGLAIFASALYWRLNNPKAFQGSYTKHFRNIFWYLVVVSLGTALFHGTLLYKYQLLDELPMLLIAIEYARFLARLRTTNVCVNNKIVVWIDKALNASNIIVCLLPLTYFVHPVFQIVSFHVVLKIYECAVMFLLIVLSRQLNSIVYEGIWQSHREANVKLGGSCTTMKTATNCAHRLTSFKQGQYTTFCFVKLRQKLSRHIRIGLTMYACSMVAWGLENAFCHQLQFLQLHAWWHVLSSVGIYHLNKIMEYHGDINKIFVQQ
jgi:hypothetical protein